MKEKQIIKEMIAWVERRIKELGGKSIYYQKMKEDLEKDLTTPLPVINQ